MGVNLFCLGRIFFWKKQKKCVKPQKQQFLFSNIEIKRKKKQQQKTLKNFDPALLDLGAFWLLGKHQKIVNSCLIQHTINTGFLPILPNIPT